MELRLYGQYTEQDIQRGLALVRGRAPQIAGIGIGFVMILGLLPAVISVLSGQAEAISLLASLVPTALVLGVFGIIWWKVPRDRARKLQKAPMFQGTVTGLATDEALELRSEQAEDRTKWAAFDRYRMSDEIVLLYQNNAASNFVPRGLFASDKDWQQFQQLVQATVPEKAPVLAGIFKW